MKFLRLSDKRADDNFRAGKTWGHEVVVPSKNVMKDGKVGVWREKDESKFNFYGGLNSDARKFLQANGAFMWHVRETREAQLVIFRIAREDAAMMFKLKFT